MTTARIQSELCYAALPEYVTASAPTIRAAIDTAFRHARLVNDAADLRLEVHGKKVYAILSVPADDMEYRDTFGDTKIAWSAPLDGYVFDAEWLDTPLPSADANLHTLLRKHVDQTMGKLPPANSLVPADHRAEHRRHCIRAETACDSFPQRARFENGTRAARVGQSYAQRSRESGDREHVAGLARDLNYPSTAAGGRTGWRLPDVRLRVRSVPRRVSCLPRSWWSVQVMKLRSG